MCALEVQLLGVYSLFSYFFWDSNCRVLYVPTSLLHVEERAKEASVLVSLQRHLGLMVVQRANSLGAQCRLQASIDLCQPPCWKPGQAGHVSSLGPGGCNLHRVPGRREEGGRTSNQNS